MSAPARLAEYNDDIAIALAHFINETGAERELQLAGVLFSKFACFPDSCIFDLPISRGRYMR